MKKISVAAAAKEWIALKAEEKKIEKRLRELKNVLEPALRESSELTREFHGHKFSLVEFTKRSFSLAKAEKKIDGRILAPYITESDVSQIRMTWEGCEARAAA